MTTYPTWLHDKESHFYRPIHDGVLVVGVIAMQCPGECVGELYWDVDGYPVILEKGERDGYF